MQWRGLRKSSRQMGSAAAFMGLQFAKDARTQALALLSAVRSERSA
jgi:hypothetical protein